MGLSVIDESLENTELDFVESNIKEIADLSFCKYESKPNYFEGEQQGVYSPKFPVIRELSKGLLLDFFIKIFFT